MDPKQEVNVLVLEHMHRVCVCACVCVCIKSLNSLGQGRGTFSLDQIMKDHGWFFSETIIHGSL